MLSPEQDLVSEFEADDLDDNKEVELTINSPVSANEMFEIENTDVENDEIHHQGDHIQSGQVL